MIRPANGEPIHHYRVIATRESPWWLITVPDLDGIATQSVRWAGVEDMARDLIDVYLDVAIDEVSVTVERSPVAAGPPGGLWLHARVWADEAGRLIRSAVR
jgi:predicted RNase H-like HicB family nuclease